MASTMMRNIASSSSSSSSVSTPNWIYDVFLSFTGVDVRKNFVDFLYDALEQKGIYTFKDDEKLERGRFISPALRQAIQQSRIAVIIFSVNYAYSSWCLDELAEIMDCNRLLGQIVLPVFYYVDPSVVRKQKGRFRKALAKHRKEIGDKERIQSWRKALAEAASIAGWDVRSIDNGHVSKCIQRIVKYIMAKLEIVVTVDEKDKVGIDSRVQKIDALLKLGSDDVRFVGIWGMSGIGKTTIARAVFDRIVTHFEGCAFLHEVRECLKKDGLNKLQENILSKILSLKDWRIDNVFEGSCMIKRRLCYKKVLIVLDDIDGVDQLEALAGKHDWFGAGSRIIITTRDKHLLRAHEVNQIHEVELLYEHEAIQLLSWKAFKNDYPPRDFEMLASQIVQYAGGLPLALEVLGSFLYGRDMDEWRSEVERLKRIPEDDITKKLRVSFDGLKEIEKQIFLDIACFFKGKKLDRVKRVLDSFDFYPDIGIRVLVEKSLVTVSKGRIQMHRLIQEMGWFIIREEAPQEPGKQSRLWVKKDICHVLATDKVTENIQALWLDLHTPEDVVFKNEAFEKMNRLRLLRVRNVRVSRDPNYIPSEMRWLNWHGYPSKYLPTTFQAEKLVGLKLQSSCIVELWKGYKLLDKLKFINLSNSDKLIRTPDFTGIPNLEILILEDCSSLFEIHPSAGYLKRLRLINLRNCTSLRRLPKQILLENLEEIILSGCSKVDEFPEILGTMNCLRTVYLEATAIKVLPSSIGRLKCLEVFILSGCSKLDKLPEELGHLERLEELYCDETAISQLPSSIILLKNLKLLSLRGSKGLASRTWSSILFSWMLRKKCQDSVSLVFPYVSGLSSLVQLDLSDCNMLDGGFPFPCDLGSLSSLVKLNLRGNNFSSVSVANIKNLSRLKLLRLDGCKRLEIFPELPSSIEHVSADDCTSLQSASALLTKYPKLCSLSFSNCFQLLQDRQTSNVIDETWKQMLKELSPLDRRFCVCLPGRTIPAWFNYQTIGPSISIELPLNWLCNEFMGLAICIASDTYRSGMRREIFSISILLKFVKRCKRLCESSWITGFLRFGNNSYPDNTFLAFLPRETINMTLPEEQLPSLNDCSCMTLFPTDPFSDIPRTVLGVRLVYKKDVE